MALSKKQFIDYLKDADFRTLFIEEMGWNKYSASMADVPTMYVDDKAYNLRTVAHRNGFQVLVCNVQELPSHSTCKKLDTKLRKAANDYICIFVIPGTEHHQWVAPVKMNEKRDIVIIEYAEAEKAQFLYEKISGLTFDLDEITTIIDVKERVQGAFAINSEKITKDFYAGFNKQHKAFAEFITGIDDQVDTKDNKNKQWYTSVMLNRLMFCYFIQKKGFLDGDEHYLRNKLRWVQEQRGSDQFFRSFYKDFLIHLFHRGLNSPKHDDAFENVYGRIPYLNGGMFDDHQIEREYADIDIKDEAFESLFEFFDKWRWHLDTRVTASGKDINPDVLGYIFEQYINDRAQMGAYYTKEDITEYIGRNTIIPYLLEATAKSYPEAFAQEGPFWTFIRQSGDCFLYDAVKKGVHEAIPEDIACGFDTEAPDLLERRKFWNNATPANIGLPTEIWRETIERIGRYNEIVDRIRDGRLGAVNDLITYNLNTPKIAYDYLNATNDQKFIMAFYDELLKVTILDPTCGSGAFLFAALNLLEPLYEVCITRMQEFHEQDQNAFREQLSEIENKYRSNIQYFIYKSIILRNLYGVDIMAEAVEIAKLRLFLKMVAVVDVDKRADNMGLDPLPDVDFNIRCGNTLVGYATEQQLFHDLDVATNFIQQIANQEFKDKLQVKLHDVADTYEIFRLEQLSKDSDIELLKQAKGSLNNELSSLNELLNKHLFASSGQSGYEDWLKSHQPFHWMAEYYHIMHSNGGFDVVIGNPPYVEYFKKNTLTKKSVCDIYKIPSLKTRECGNLYAYCLERSLYLSNSLTRLGFIVPSASLCTPRMHVLSSLLQESGILWSSLWDERPAKLFDGVDQQLCIHLLDLSRKDEAYITRMNHWSSEYRPYIFSCLGFINYDINFEIAEVCPKVQSLIEKEILSKLVSGCRNLEYYTLNKGTEHVYYRTAGGRYWKLFKTFPTFFKSGMREFSSTENSFAVIDGFNKAIVALLSSSLFYFYWRAVSNCRHVTNRELFAFPICNLNDSHLSNLKLLAERYEEDLISHKRRVNTHSERSGDIVQDFYFARLSKDVVDQIDILLADYYGFDDVELEYIINYDIKYRLGEEQNDD